MEPDHADCDALIQRLRAGAIPIVVPSLLLAEVAGAISRARRDPIRARVFVATLRALPNLTLVPLDEELAQQAADLAGDHRLRGADAVYAAVAAQFGAMLVTLDEEQRARAGAIVATQSPTQALANRATS